MTEVQAGGLPVGSRLVMFWDAPKGATVLTTSQRQAIISTIICSREEGGKFPRMCSQRAPHKLGQLDPRRAVAFAGKTSMGAADNVARLIFGAALRHPRGRLKEWQNSRNLPDF